MNNAPTPNQEHHFFLRKSGKSFGPFSEKQIEEMKASSNYEDYAWVWDSHAPEWKAIEPPPPPLSTSTVETPKPAKKYPSKSASLDLAGGKWHDVSKVKIAVTCHDQRSAVTGTLKRVSDRGCELVSPGHEGGPPFPDRAKIVLNLFDPASGKSQNIPGTLAKIRRKDSPQTNQAHSGAWIYLIRWKSCPDLLLGA
jgi:hypothetical protein